VRRKILSSLLVLGLLIPAFQMERARAENDLGSNCRIGSDESCPAQSPQEIVNLYGTNTNGAYWINVNGVARETYLILNSSYPDGGSWFLGMKGSNSGNSFIYSSNL